MNAVMTWLTNLFRGGGDDKLRSEHALMKSFIEKNQLADAFTLTSQKHTLEQEYAQLVKSIAEKRKELLSIEDRIELQDYGFYFPTYNLSNSEEYRKRIEEIQSRQKAMIKQGTAATCNTHWTINNRRALGNKLVKENMQMILRCYNNECETAIAKVKHNSLDASKRKISTAFQKLNKHAEILSIKISPFFHELKIEELCLVFEYQRKKQEEKEEIAAYKERLREAAKVEKEIEEAREKNNKERRHYENRIAYLRQASAKSDLSRDEQSTIERELEIANKGLNHCLKMEQDLDFREQNASAGYVYVISNFGAFGKDVYKIGVTRRLDPIDRINELSSASVPFRFDVHAIVFSENAYQLESALHKTFEANRVNLVNPRKEFFRISLKEINEALKANFKKHFELNPVPEAAQFRATVQLRRSNQ